MRNQLLILALLAIATTPLLACDSAAEPPVAKASALSPTRLAERPPKAERATELSGYGVPEHLALKSVIQLNANAFVPPQCYTKTIDEAGRAHNPCFTCHVASRAPNFIDDGDIQLEYDFVPAARKNAWKTIFTDWTPQLATVSDDEITAYVRSSNYVDAAGAIALARTLAALPAEWDLDGDGKWAGYVPDARFDFDEQGWDRAPDGTRTGWRAFSYYPLPGTFWPTNGSFGDALIRLPEAFRVNEAGTPDLGVYATNLAILEALIARRAIAIAEADETALSVDLDLDGKLGRATRIAFEADEHDGSSARMSFVGKARLEQREGRVHLAAGLFPEGTEFQHSVRYIDPAPDGVRMAARFKELRYARKIEWWSYERLRKRASAEAEDKVNSPAEQRAFGGNIEIGVANGQGWRFQGYIEDAAGALRPQTYEESAYCAGCHGGVGVTDDSIVSFGRKLPFSAFRSGWFHASQRGLARVPDRPRADGGTEYVTYLEQNGAGDEFRQNTEVLERFFDRDGRLKPDMKAKLQRDITTVLLPSKERALALDKAYLLLVRSQKYQQGRDLVLDGARNVHRELSPGQRTGIEQKIAPPHVERETPTTARRRNATKSS